MRTDRLNKIPSLCCARTLFEQIHAEHCSESWPCRLSCVSHEIAHRITIVRHRRRIASLHAAHRSTSASPHIGMQHRIASLSWTAWMSHRLASQVMVPGATGRCQVPQDGARYHRMVPGTTGWCQVPQAYLDVFYQLFVGSCSSRRGVCCWGPRGPVGAKKQQINCVQPL